MKNEEIFLSGDAAQVLKFHGTYQQDDRDRRTKGEQKKYQFMLRLKMPAGELTPELYRVLDDLSENYGNGTLRATTRGTFQVHGVLKGNLKHVMSSIMNAGGSTAGACGDINRNITATPAPFQSPPYQHVRYIAKMLAEVFAPQTGALCEVWLDGEKAATIEYWKKDIDMDEVKRIREYDNGHGQVFHDKEEPIYGETYLPRKFKMGVTVPGDNSIDIFTNDIGIVVIMDERNVLQGYNILVGGGMGRTHNKEATFPRLADPLGFVAPESFFDTIKSIVAAQRDHGDREVRANARMKYLVHKLGIDGFRDLVRSYMADGGSALQPWRPIADWEYRDYLGWHEDGTGNLFYGLLIDNGRVRGPLKKALRQIVDELAPSLVITPHQNLLMTNIRPEQRTVIEGILEKHGVYRDVERIDQLVRKAMACPALPLCPLAITEAERAMPDHLERVRAILGKAGIPPSESFVMRMTGCPNGCSRPYTAELALVGSGPNGVYQLWLGGSPNQTRLAWVFADRLSPAELDRTLESIFVFWKQDRRLSESFGDFCDRVGKNALEQFVAQYNGSSTNGKITDEHHDEAATAGSFEQAEPRDPNEKVPIRPRVSLRPSVHARLRAMAARAGVPLKVLVDEILTKFIASPESEEIFAIRGQPGASTDKKAKNEWSV
jgi:sulfite reductase (ferredoxin)